MEEYYLYQECQMMVINMVKLILIQGPHKGTSGIRQVR